MLLLTHYGRAERLTVAGHPAGRLLPRSARQGPEPGEGSCIGVVVTDAPLDPAACERLARRVGLGLARTGSVADHGSGEIFLACATGTRGDWGGRVRQAEPVMQGAVLAPFFEAVVDASEEAVLNSLLMAPTVTGRSGHVRHAIPVDDLRRILAAS